MNNEENHDVIENKVYTVEELKSLVPNGIKTVITDAFVDKFNTLTANAREKNPLLYEVYRKNVIGYSSVLKGRSTNSIQDYLNAVIFVSHLGLGSTVIDAYKATFPDRYLNLKSEGREYDAHRYANAYKLTKMVTALLEQNVIPTYILYQDVKFETLGVVRDIVLGKEERVSTKNKIDAANVLLTYIKEPAESRIRITTEDDTVRSVVSDLKDVIKTLSEKQSNLIEQGSMNIVDVAEQELVKDE